MPELTDEELVARYQSETDTRRSSRTVDELFQRHHRRVAGWCYRMTGSVESASDLAQDIFLKAFQNLRGFRGDARFTTWLYTIARNRCMDELRSRAGRPEETTDAELEETPDLRFEDAVSKLERKQASELMRRLMRDSLDPVEMQVMTLHYVEELPLDSITRMLGLTNASGAKGYIVSARRKLSRAIASQGAGHAE